MDDFVAYQVKDLSTVSNLPCVISTIVCDPIEHALATSQPVARPRFLKAVDWRDHLRDRISNHDRRSAIDRGPDSERQTFPNGHACGNRGLRILDLWSGSWNVRGSPTTQAHSHRD